MKSWEKRADTFHFKHRTKNNNDKVSLLTSHAFKFNKPIELEDEGSYLQLGKWRFIEKGDTLCIQKQTTDTSGDTQWITKMDVA